MIQPMIGRICLVTGATNGIGKATALALAQMGATDVIVSRSPARCAEVVDEIKRISGNDAVEALTADLSVIAEVRQVADQFKAKFQQLHVLVNNAGGAFGKRQVTSEGFEKTFALNHLGYFLLVRLLLDTLKASAPARIINVSSDEHKTAHLDFDDLQSEKGNFVFNAYGRSKLAVVVFSYELARRLWKRVFQFRAGFQWYLAAIFIMIVIWLVSYSIPYRGAPVRDLLANPVLLLTAFLPWIGFGLFVPSL